MTSRRRTAIQFRCGSLLLACLTVALVLAGCGSSRVPPASASRQPTPDSGRRPGAGIPPSLLAAVRPIGRGPRFQPPAGDGPAGSCRAPLGRRLQAHVELFGADRVVLLAAGIGTRAPRRIVDGRLLRARCFGAVVTLDPTGTVYFRPGQGLTVADVFRAWGQPLGEGRIASFTGGRVRVYVDGLRRPGPPGAVPLTQDAEIVLEVGPRVPPHAHFTFASMPVPRLR